MNAVIGHQLPGHKAAAGPLDHPCCSSYRWGTNTRRYSQAI